MEKTTMNLEEESVIEKPSAITIFEKISFFIVAFVFLVLPIFFLPITIATLVYSKMFIIVTGVLISTAFLVFGAIQSGKISLPSWRSFLVFILVPVTTCIAVLFSTNKAGSLMGSGVELDTLNFVALGFLMILLVAVLFRSKQRIFWSYMGVLGMFAVVSIFHIIRFAGGPEMLNIGGVFTSVATNTVGSWNDLGIYAGLAVILSFVSIEFVSMSRLLKSTFYAVLVLALALMAVTNFYVIFGILGLSIPLTAIVGIIALFVFVYIISLNYKIKSTKRMPIASMVVMVFCIITTIAAGPISAFLYQKIGISQNDVLDVRPTLYGTYSVGKQVIASGVKHALVGFGPSNFSYAWGLFKPAGVNQTVFWNTDFNYGTGYILTTLVTTGIVGLLAWLIFLIATLIVGTRAAFRSSKDKFSTYLIVSSLLAAAYLWIMAIFYVTGPVILMFAFFFTGLLGASLLREGAIVTKEFSWTSNQKKGFVSILGLIFALILIISWMFGWSQQFVASVYARKALLALDGPADLPKAEGLMVSALQYAPASDGYLRTFAQLKLFDLQVLFQKNGKAELTSEAQQILTVALNASYAAVQRDPTNYNNWLLLGRVYETAAFLGAQGSGNNALQAYANVTALLPNSPLGPYLTGRLYALAHDPVRAKAALVQALQMKQDFTEAANLYQQIQEASPTSATLATSSPAVQTSSSPAQKKSTSSKTQATTTQR